MRHHNVLSLIVTLLFCACNTDDGEAEVAPGTDGVSDTDTDIDTDTYIDTSTDTDADTDADTDTDTDTDTDADTDTDTNTDTDTDTDDNQIPDWVCDNISCDSSAIVCVDGQIFDPGLGQTWSLAFAEIQYGIERCSCIVERCRSTCQVWVKQGEYNIYHTSPHDTVQLRQGVELYGGFAGTEMALEERDFTENLTVLNGESQVYHVVKGANESRIDGFTISKGRADSLTDRVDVHGGGMFNQGVSVEIVNCIFSDNVAWNGAGIFNQGGSVTVESSIFLNNHATSALRADAADR